MSRIRLNLMSSAPSAPPSGHMELFALSSDKKLRTIDDAGSILVLADELDYRLVTVTHIDNGTTSYTPTSGVTVLYVECVGGGGGGGGVGTPPGGQGQAASGGGGGGLSTLWTASNVSGSHTVAAGAGGSAGTGSASDVTGGTGGDGGDSTYADTAAAVVCKAKGGGGGPGGNDISGGMSTATAGGFNISLSNVTNGTGDLKFEGGQGELGVVFGATGANQIGGRGGKGWMGGGGAAETSGSDSTGINGGKYGGGGSGASCAASSGNNTGGTGGNGMIRIWEFAA